jgi:hypothetical protein
MKPKWMVTPVRRVDVSTVGTATDSVPDKRRAAIVGRSGCRWLKSTSALVRPDEDTGARQPVAADRRRAEPNHDGLESAKLDLQLMFKKPGGAAAER